ncbi:MAG: hypothetical protein QXL51_00975 [Candidatus Aenigmatarchaeota archaeon]
MDYKKIGISALLLLILGFLLSTFSGIPSDILNYQPSNTGSGNDIIYYTAYKSGNWIRYDGRVSTITDCDEPNATLYGLIGYIKYIKVKNNGYNNITLTFKDSNGTEILSQKLEPNQEIITDNLNNFTTGKIYLSTNIEYLSGEVINSTTITNATGTHRLTLINPAQTDSENATLNITYENLEDCNVYVHLNGVLLGKLDDTVTEKVFNFYQSILVNGTNNISFSNEGKDIVDYDVNSTGLAGAEGEVWLTLTPSYNLITEANATITSEIASGENISVYLNGVELGTLTGSDDFNLNISTLSQNLNFTFSGGTDSNITSVRVDYIYKDYRFNITQSKLDYNYYNTNGLIKSNFVVIGYIG